MSDALPIYVGASPEETVATHAAIFSIRQHAARTHTPVDIHQISRLPLYRHYKRPTELRDGHRWDVISNAPMSTDHAIARFFIPWLRDYRGWALFVDGDVLFRRSPADLFALADPRYAVMCVQHPPLRDEGLKKDGTAIQLSYARKNWSSVLLFNCGHEENQLLTLDVLNRWPGRDLHGFRWLSDASVGALPPEWNYLVNVNAHQADPAIVHYTEGTPNLAGHTGDPFAAEWFDAAVGAGYRFAVPDALNLYASPAVSG